MNTRMLVDASHAEEIRVAIVQDNRLTHLEIEHAGQEQLKGNIYLAKVTRVEASLQAAFVEFHGGRQGFLPLSDIHPKYYPNAKPTPKPVPQTGKPQPPTPAATDPQPDAGDPLPPAAALEWPTGETGDETLEEPTQVGAEEEHGEEVPAGDEEDDEFPPEDEEEEESPGGERRLRTSARRPPRPRRIPIQNLLTRGQTLLVQVVKESRGTKGASLTTNLALPGRFCVLLPETAQGGGISRKITDIEARKALKEIWASLPMPEDVSLIIRTAGMDRNKREIKRDLDYLLRLWKEIQEKAEKAKAPAIIYEEGDLILRTIRDLYTTDMEEVLIEGADAYRRGKDFMRLLMPRHVKVVQPYKEQQSIFSHYKVENQIESMHERIVSLRSGGYLVIDPTEALVSIDINSGRATREKDIEATAFKTNLEAAEEIARQMRLRDLGGLIIIDFIDMEDKRHNAEVEKRLKDATKGDRAKLQLGRISQFGLLELSRQRLRPAFSEANRQICPRCQGVGSVRSVESAGIHLFRCIEEDVHTGRYRRLTYRATLEVAHFLLNSKRLEMAQLEQEHKVAIVVKADPTVQFPEFHTVREEKPGEAPVRSQQQNQPRSGGNAPNRPPAAREAAATAQEQPPTPSAQPRREQQPTRRPEAEPAANGPPPAAAAEANAEGAVVRKRRRRRRRRGAGAPTTPQNPGLEGNLTTAAEQPVEAAAATPTPATPLEPVASEAPATSGEVTAPPRRAPRPRRAPASRRPAGDAPSGEESAPPVAAASEEAPPPAATAAPRRRTRKPAVTAAPVDAEEQETTPAPTAAPRRRTRRPAAAVPVEGAVASNATEVEPPAVPAENQNHAEGETTGERPRPRRRRRRRPATPRPAAATDGGGEE